MERKRNKLQKRGGSDAGQGIMSQHWPYKQNDQPLSPGLRPEGGGASSGRYKAYNAYSAGASPVTSPTGRSFESRYQAVSPGGGGGGGSGQAYPSPGGSSHHVASTTYANYSPYANGLVSPPIGGHNGWGHVPSASASGSQSKSWNGEGSGYMAELETPVVGPSGQAVFEMSGEDISIPAVAKSENGEEARKKEDGEVKVPVQANPWPFYLDLPIRSEDAKEGQNESQGGSQEIGKGKQKEEEEAPPPAVPWPYHGPGDSSNPSVTVEHAAAEPQRRKSAGDGEKPNLPEDMGISVLDEYLSDMGIEDDDLQAQVEQGEDGGVERKDSLLKVRPLSLASRMRASSVGAVPAGGGKTYVPYNPSNLKDQEGTEDSNAQDQAQQPHYPVGTAPHHFYIPQSLAPPRKPLPSGSPVSPNFPSGPLHTSTSSSNPLSPPKQPPPAPLSPPPPAPAPAPAGRSSPGYVAYRPPSRGTSPGQQPSLGHPPLPPPPQLPGGGGGGFVAYNPDGPASPTQNAPAHFTPFNANTQPTSPRQDDTGRFATYRKPTVSSPSEEPTAQFVTTPPYPVDGRYASPPVMGQPPNRYASPPNMDQPHRYASPPILEGRLASPPITGGFPRPTSHDSPAQPSPVSSLGGSQQPHRVSPNTTGGRNPSPQAPPPLIPTNQPPQEQYHHTTTPPPNGSAATGQGLGLPPSPGIPSSPPPPYMPVDLPPRPGSAGVPPSYRSSPSPPPRVGSYGPLRPSVTGDGSGYSHQTRPHAQSQPPPPVPSSRPQPPPAQQHQYEAVPPPLPPRRTTSPPLPSVPPQIPPRPTAASAAAPQGFGRGVPSAMNFPPPPKASSHPRPGAAHAPRPGPTRPPAAPSTQRPQGQSSSSSSSHRPQPSTQRPGHVGGPHQRPPPQHSHSTGSGWRPSMGNNSSGGYPPPEGRGSGSGVGGDMFWSASAKRWLNKTERLVEQTLGDIMQPQVDQGRGQQMPGGYPRGRGR